MRRRGSAAHRGAVNHNASRSPRCTPYTPNSSPPHDTPSCTSEAQRRRLIRSTRPPRSRNGRAAVVAARPNVTVVEFPRAGRRAPLATGADRYSRPHARGSPWYQPRDDRADDGTRSSEWAGQWSHRRTRRPSPSRCPRRRGGGRRQDPPAPRARRLDPGWHDGAGRPSRARLARTASRPRPRDARRLPDRSRRRPRRWRSTPWRRASATDDRWSSSRTCTGPTPTASGCSNSWPRCRCPS